MVPKARILIADDEPHIRRILQFLLEKEGFEIELVSDGEEAWKAVASFHPDLVLLDLMMPKMDGFEVLKIIRTGFETARLPVILLTAKGEEEDKVKGLRGGANDYIMKPFNHDELMLRVSNLLEATRREREANPLTGLPGNRAIEREIQKRISSDDDFAFMYIDIDRFKSFNDRYGYSRGDRAISFLAGVLVGNTQKYGAGNEFVGHVGGDDFVVVSESAVAQNLANRIVREFDEGKGELHDADDWQNGFLELENRNGEVERFPLITVTLALVQEVRGRFEHPAQLSDTMAELKRYGKTMPQSVVVRERRAADSKPELILSGSDSADPDKPGRG
jgi:PleD family two-component response regulator